MTCRFLVCAYCFAGFAFATCGVYNLLLRVLVVLMVFDFVVLVGVFWVVDLCVLVFGVLVFCFGWCSLDCWFVCLNYWCFDFVL